MRLLFTVILCLFLGGCSSQPEMPPVPTEAPITTEDPSIAASYGTAVKAYSLAPENVEQILPFGDGLLLKSQQELLLLDNQLQRTSSIELNLDTQVRVSGRTIAVFDPATRQLSLLDDGLSVIRQLNLPEDLSGSPMLNSDGSVLYYCTSRGIYGWDLSSGIRRRIREISGSEPEILGLHWQDHVIQCRVREGSQIRDLFLDTSQGQLLKKIDTRTELKTLGSAYYCSYTFGSYQNLIFGRDDTPPKALLPDVADAEGIFLPERHAAVTLSPDSAGSIKLDLYALDTGRLEDTLLLNPEHFPKAIVCGNQDSLFLLVSGQQGEFLLQWFPRKASLSGKDHTDLYFTDDDPDYAGISLCRDYARQLSEEYGLEIFIWKDATAIQPWDYTFLPEHRYPVILQQLQTLETGLSRYPKSMIRDTAAHFDSLKICLVGQIQGLSPQTGPSDPTGIQFFEGNNAYLALEAGPYARQSLDHELFHVMETHILCSSSALDAWEKRNPSGFSYDLDHEANARRNSGVYLSGDSRAFVDTYSMSFPKEDRARLFEYAMLPDQTHLFRSKIMQDKLHALCTGIREAYGLKKVEEIFPWEQYLQ